MSEQADLIAKLSEATGPDREIDVLIWAVAQGHELEWQGTTLVAGYEGVIGWIDPGVHSRNFRTNRAATGPSAIPAYTASVDAALALIEKRLPDRLVENFGEMRDSGPLTGHWLAQLGPRGPRRRLVGPITGANLQATLDAEVLCSAETGPLALCIALLKALQAQTDAALKPEGGS